MHRLLVSLSCICLQCLYHFEQVFSLSRELNVLSLRIFEGSHKYYSFTFIRNVGFNHLRFVLNSRSKRASLSSTVSRPPESRVITCALYQCIVSKIKACLRSWLSSSPKNHIAACFNADRRLVVDENTYQAYLHRQLQVKKTM